MKLDYRTNESSVNNSDSKPNKPLGWRVCEEGFEGEVEEVQKKGNGPFAPLGSIRNPTILRN